MGLVQVKGKGLGTTKDITPGPGTYKIPARIQDVPGYLLPNRSVEFKYV